MNRFFLAALVAAAVASCATPSSSSSEGSSQNAMTEDNSPVVTPADVPWKDMTKQQRGRYMAKIVTPKMHEVFKSFDAEKYAKVNCATCHGKNAKEKGFKMPSPDLPALPSSEEEFMATTMKEKPEMVKFMGEHVTPEMAQLLGLKPFDPQHPDPNAFSCHACHTLKGEKKEEAHPTGG